MARLASAQVVIERYYEAYNSGDIDTIAGLLAEDVSYHGEPNSIHSRACQPGEGRGLALAQALGMELRTLCTAGGCPGRVGQGGGGWTHGLMTFIFVNPSALLKHYLRMACPTFLSGRRYDLRGCL